MGTTGRVLRPTGTEGQMKAGFLGGFIAMMSGGPAGAGGLVLQSQAFSTDGEIPRVHTCQGADRSPALGWSGVPAGTKSLALIVDDPDAPDPAAPKMVWVHWVVYNLPVSADSLSEAVSALPEGARDGKNDWGRSGYGGPCPPIGRHRYFHKLYALDVVLPDLDTPTKAALLAAMEGHIIGQTELVGTYQKSD